MLLLIATLTNETKIKSLPFDVLPKQGEGKTKTIITP